MAWTSTLRIHIRVGNDSANNVHGDVFNNFFFFCKVFYLPFNCIDTPVLQCYKCYDFWDQLGVNRNCKESTNWKSFSAVTIICLLQDFVHVFGILFNDLGTFGKSLLVYLPCFLLLGYAEILINNDNDNNKT